MAAASSKLYRFPPTRRLYADYDVVVPGAKKRGRHARELDEYLRQQEEDEVAAGGGREPEREYPVSLPPVQTVSDDVESSEDSSHESWSSKLEGPLLRKIATLRRALYLAGRERKEAENGIRILMKSARESASAIASVLSQYTPGANRPEEVVASLRVTCATSGCGQRALPFSRFCLHHMSGDPDQVLYGTCTASEPGSGVCGNTVPDFLLNQPLCSKHVTKTALETAGQQQQQKRKTAGGTARPTKSKGKSQKNKKNKVAAAATKLVVTKSSPAVATTSAGLGLSSTSSWSSGESDGEKPLTSEPKRTKVIKSVQLPPSQPVKAPAAGGGEPHQLPPLAPEATLDLSLPSSMPIPSLILPPPLPDIGRFMDDSSSEES